MFMLSARLPVLLLLGKRRGDPTKFRSQDMIGKSRSAGHMSFRVFLVPGPFPLPLNSHEVMKDLHCTLQLP